MSLRLMTILGLVVSLSLSGMYVELAVFSSEAMAFEQCSDDAITIAAEARCEEGFRKAVEERMAAWRGGESVTPSATPTS